MKGLRNILLVSFIKIVAVIPHGCAASDFLQEEKDILTPSASAEVLPVSINIRDVMDLASFLYDTENPTDNSEHKQPLTELICSMHQVSIEQNGDSIYVDAIGKLADGQYINVSPEAEWITDNADVAIVYGGRILATGKGNATVTVLYGNYSQVIQVNVLNEVNIEAESERIEQENLGENEEKSVAAFAFTSSERESITKRGEAMVSYRWTPKKDLKGWKNKYTFKAGKAVTGIPYSQTPHQCDEHSFAKNLNSSNFYTSYSGIMPMYGNDCSGFVSFAWGIKRNTTTSFVAGIKNGTYAKVGHYNVANPIKKDLMTAYRSLRKGDAVVKKGHTFLIKSNDPQKSIVYAYEQTPYYARVTRHSYDKMSNDRYMPFTKK